MSMHILFTAISTRVGEADDEADEDENDEDIAGEVDGSL